MTLHTLLHFLSRRSHFNVVCLLLCCLVLLYGCVADPETDQEAASSVSTSSAAVSSSVGASSSSQPEGPAPEVVPDAPVSSSVASSEILTASSASSSFSSASSASSLPVKIVSVPGRVQAQDYANAKDDDERQGDTSGICALGIADMKATDDNNGECKIGWTLAGEWVEYKLTSNSDGDFDLVLRLASKENTRRIRVALNGKNLGELNAPGKGFDQFENRTLKKVALKTGEHTLRVVFVDGGVDFNYLDIVDHVAEPSNASSSSSASGINRPTKSVLETGKFLHPGLFSTHAQLDFVKAQIKAGKQPWANAFNKLENTKPHLRKVEASAVVKAEPNKPGSSSANRKAMDSMTRDGSAAYASALLWYFTGEDKYRKFTINTLNAWSIYQSGGMPLYHTWMVPHFLNAAELMAHTPGAGWKASDIKKFKQMVSSRWWQPVRIPPKEDSNQAGSATEAQLAIAIFTDDVSRFNTALANHKKIMKKFIYMGQKGRLDGETANTCRDITHVKLGTHGLMYGAEYLWNQNIDMWTQERKRWATFAEFHAGIMEGTDPSPNVCGWKGASRRGVVYCAGATGEKQPPCQQVPWHILINHVGDRLNANLPLTRDMEDGRYMGQITHRNTKWETLLKSSVPASIR